MTSVSDKSARPLRSKNISENFAENFDPDAVALSDDLVIISRMIEARDIPDDLSACQVLLRVQTATIESQDEKAASQRREDHIAERRKLEEHAIELEKLRKAIEPFRQRPSQREADPSGREPVVAAV